MEDNFPKILPHNTLLSRFYGFSVNIIYCIQVKAFQSRESPISRFWLLPLYCFVIYHLNGIFGQQQALIGKARTILSLKLVNSHYSLMVLVQQELMKKMFSLFNCLSERKAHCLLLENTEKILQCNLVSLLYYPVCVGFSNLKFIMVLLLLVP